MKKAFIVLFIFAILAACLTGCQKRTMSAMDAGSTAALDAVNNLEIYLASVREKSEAINTSLEQDELTQTDMNLKSQELRTLWEEALNHLLDEAKKILPAAEMEKLTAEQRTWATDVTAAVDAAGKEVEGGSLYALVTNTKAARMTQERVYKLFEQLK